MDNARFSRWVQVSGDKVIVYTQPKYFRIFAWVLCLITQLGLIYIVYANEQEPWLALLWVPLGIILLFHATRNVVFNRANRTFSVKIWGITFRKKTWQKMRSYSLGQKIIQYDHHRPHVPADHGYPLYLHFDADKVWITQGRQASELQQLAIAIQEMLEA
ncbi:MAG: hypothetical protein ACKV1O_11875 [Saprospiraceae bacterium]